MIILKNRVFNTELENSKEKLMENIEILNRALNNTSSEIDKNKLMVMLIEQNGIDPFANIGVKEIADDLGMNQNSVNNLFKREDFPGLSITRPKQVCFLSYLIWKMERRV